MGIRWGSRAVGVGVAAFAVLGVAGCSGATTPAKTTATTLSASPLPTWSASSSPSPGPTVKLPTTAQLAAALVTAGDLGSTFTKASGGGSGSVSGCKALAVVINGSNTSPSASADYQATSVGPFVGETLTTDTPANLNAGYAQAKAAMTSCSSLTFSSDGTSVTMTLSPISFGGQSVAVRMDGTTQGVQMNGYLVLGRLPRAVLGYYYLQIDGSSSQVAYAEYQQAAAKAQRILGGR